MSPVNVFTRLGGGCKHTEVMRMSRKEIDRVSVMTAVIERRLSLKVAASQMGVSKRHIIRQVQAYRTFGPDGLISKRRDKPSNHRYSDDVKRSAQSILRQHYHDFGL